VVNVDVASRKVARASAWLNDAEEILSRPTHQEYRGGVVALRRFLALVSSEAGL